MRLKQLALLLIIVLVSPFFVNATLPVDAQAAQSSPSLYLGVDIAFESMPQTIQLIDNISAYTNLIIIGCAQKIGSNGLGGGVYNQTRLSFISQYVYDKGLNFIVYSDDPSYPSKQWLENATKEFGSHFLGLYYLDEPGGKQLDQAVSPAVTSAENFSDAADQYVTTINQWLRNSSYAITNNFDYPTEYQLFTSDYGLYWYDYEAGYNTVFAEFGVNAGNENYSRQLSISLCRGAATAFNQSWGVMITDESRSYPYMENSSQLYNDMVLAYENDAKYIVVFDSNLNYTQTILSSQQLNAIKQFWQYAQENPRTVSLPSDRSAYVLPEDYGYGFRDPNDTIWGLWTTDYDGAASLNFTTDISMCVVTFLQMFGQKLDILYANGNVPIRTLGYQNLIYWNDTTIIPNIPNMPAASPAVSSYQAQFPKIGSPSTTVTLLLYGVVIGIVVSLVATSIALRFRKRSNPPRPQSKASAFVEADHEKFCICVAHTQSLANHLINRFSYSTKIRNLNKDTFSENLLYS